MMNLSSEAVSTTKAAIDEAVMKTSQECLEKVRQHLWDSFEGLPAFERIQLTAEWMNRVRLQVDTREDQVFVVPMIEFPEL